MVGSQWVYERALQPRSPVQLAEAVLSSRGYESEAQASFLEPNFEDSQHDCWLLPDMKKAIDRLVRAAKRSEKVVIYGDYDIDGLTASTLLLDGLTSFGIEAQIYIPDRFEEGYGLNLAALKKIKQAGADLVITVDCGITAVGEISQARGFGLDIIITDHHNPPDELPTDAIALVNPKLPGSKYPFAELAGVGVAYKLILALQSRLPNRLAPGQEKWLLDLVALGTVCDVVPLIDENRTLVLFGLKVLTKSRRVGIRALAKASGVEIGQIKSDDLGFRIGPRLNAAGRLTHANQSLSLLTATDMSQATEITCQLDRLNTARQNDTANIVETATQMAEEFSQGQILVLASPDWSHGVVGIAAARIAETYAKPTILLQIQDGVAKGSARSVGQFSIIEAISDSAELLEKFGGHHFAAGMTIRSNKIDQFRNKINQYARNHLDPIDRIRRLEIDLILQSEILSLVAARDLTRLAPFGNQNREPLLLSQLTLTAIRPIGKDLKHLKLTFVTTGGKNLEAVAFSSADKWPWVKIGSQVEVLYRLNINQWREVERLQLEIVDMRLPTEV